MMSAMRLSTSADGSQAFEDLSGSASHGLVIGYGGGPGGGGFGAGGGTGSGLPEQANEYAFILQPEDRGQDRGQDGRMRLNTQAQSKNHRDCAGGRD